MNPYHFIRPLVHSFSPEKSHDLAIKALKSCAVPAPRAFSHSSLEQNILGLDFKHPVGLAAGFDKNADVVPALFKQGFSFVEAGTVTPKAQEGNPKPRLFRLTEDQAIINRMGFNNHGKEHFRHNINNLSLNTENKNIFGINIGKNKTSPNDASDYLTLLEDFYAKSHYITVNISSPNTPNLRDMQSGNELTELLDAITQSTQTLAQQHEKKIPIFVKIAPDMTEAQTEFLVENALKFKIDGLIVSNTTLSRDGLKSRHKDEAGGLSGTPLFHLSTQMLKRVYQLTNGSIPLIGVGGISNGRDAYIKIRNGASLVQIYSILIYEGFHVIPAINKELVTLLERDGLSHISEAVGIDC